MNENLKALSNLINSLNDLEFKSGFNRENLEIENFFSKMLKLYIEKSLQKDIPSEMKTSIEITASQVYLYYGNKKILIEDFSKIPQQKILANLFDKKDFIIKKVKSELEKYVLQYKELKEALESLFFDLKGEFYSKFEVNYPLFSNKEKLKQNFNLSVYDFGDGFSMELDVENLLGVEVKNCENDSSIFSYDTTLFVLEKSIRNQLKKIEDEIKNNARAYVKVKLKIYLTENYPEISYSFRRKLIFIEDSESKRIDLKQFPVEVLTSESELPIVSQNIYNYFKLMNNKKTKKIFSNFSLKNVGDFDFEKGLIPLNLTKEKFDFALSFVEEKMDNIINLEMGNKHEVSEDFKIYKSIYYKVLKSFHLNGKSYHLIKYRNHLSKKYKYISIENGIPISRTKFNRKQKKSTFS